MIDRAAFARDGFVAGIPALSAAELQRYRAALLGLYDALPADLQKHFINLHGVLDWAAALGWHRAILDAVVYHGDVPDTVVPADMAALRAKMGAELDRRSKLTAEAAKIRRD